MRILVACEYSGVVREAFKALGHDAWSCDILPTEYRATLRMPSRGSIESRMGFDDSASSVYILV